ncbi:RNA polymerase sigma factor [Saccharospirillum salsuginis]|uniref:DNA-directed RNA polymerase sigma-70 factor n=1 Tax=Saccharospirillum salsuginis TaxID=418750 RepID=A0A918N887_9GAMM|nr:RNA polymerase sigma factor [Saccharospirillum salsuginis]GGX47103.1 DNA-directed RNA polymerase sigma-70 factor [Saccharospirillum salsuginis]
MNELLERLYQTESRPVLATLIRLLGDFDLAEEALHEAFAAALKQWPQSGVPDNPRAWLVSAGRFKAIDQIRRRAKFDAHLNELATQLTIEAEQAGDEEPPDIEDDQLRLIFTCCHPSLGTEAQLALTLREVCGLTTEEIARAFLTKPSTLAQRIVRAKNKIRDAGIPYEVPEARELPERLHAVLQVVYLLFNESYSASSGDTLIRTDLSREAIRLGRLLCQLLTANEARGLLALMMLHDARRAARTDDAGDLIRLEDQDRSLWHHEQIREGVALVQDALASGPAGPYCLQAAIAAVHAEAPSVAETDWGEIVGLYDLLFERMPNAVVALNRAAAIAMRDGPEAGLSQIESLLAQGNLANYHLAHAARADLYRRLGRVEDARQAYRTALALTEQGPEQRFLERQLEALTE